MKLISCYIENFGGLSQYALEFSDGLTVIQEPNGFGKTTLAEFLRAMFYGFPRKAKTLDKSRRQKYTPWGGGKCGGNLVFEHEGVRYRLERTFGATPRGDSFHLIDLENGRKSDRFSEEIGLELFQLDADSFERSTYMPQLQDSTALTTTGIQAKLTRLVEDTNDLGNFDKAMQTLKTKRSAFVPYRGSGGTVAEAAAQISRIQQELNGAEQQKAELEQCTARIAKLEERIAQKKTEIDCVREQWEQASKVEAARQQYEDLMTRYQNVTGQLQALQEQYPLGMPAETEIDAARETADQLSVLEAQQVTGQADLDAQRILEVNGPRFEGRLPRQEELEALRQACENHGALRAKLEHTGLSAAEEQQYETLHAAFGSGALNETQLDELAEQNRLLLRQRAALDGIALPEEDRQRMNHLTALFAGGVPSEEELSQQRQTLDHCEALRQENERLAASMTAQAARNRPSVPGMALLAVGILGLVLGAVLLIMRYDVPGGVALLCGIAGLAAGAALTGKQKKENARQLARIQRQIKDNEAEIGSCEAAVREFTGCDGTVSLTAALDAMRRSREEVLTLSEKLSALREKRAAQEAAVQQTEDDLRRKLEKYFRQVTDFDKAISDLRLALGQYQDLLAKKNAAEAQIDQLKQQIGKLRQELTAFFEKYFEDVRPERFQQLLSALQRDAADYLRAKEQIVQWETRKEAHRQKLRQCREALDEFFARYGQQRSADARKQLQQMYDDFRLWQSSIQNQAQLSAQLKQFPEVPEAAADAESLKKTEQELTEAYAALTETLLEQRQTRRELQIQAERIPELSDELERWQEKKASDFQKSRTLDDTMAFLQKARESLTSSYLGPIRKSFDGYLARLTGNTEEKVFISSDLDVRLERLGQARELGYFSAGQTDTVLLCMRLALVDALFEDVKPFVILDDPFVNLDDARTAEALELLKDLGKERQIIYLTCSSSRSISV